MKAYLSFYQAFQIGLKVHARLQMFIQPPIMVLREIEQIFLYLGRIWPQASNLSAKVCQSLFDQFFVLIDSTAIVIKTAVDKLSIDTRAPVEYVNTSCIIDWDTYSDFSPESDSSASNDFSVRPDAILKNLDAHISSLFSSALPGDGSGNRLHGVPGDSVGPDEEAEEVQAYS